MRHLFTLIAVSFSALVTLPALAAQPGPGGHGGPGYPDSAPPAAHVVGHGPHDTAPSSPSYGRVGTRPAPVMELLKTTQLRQAKRLQAKYEATRAQLARQLRQAERQLQVLQARPLVRPAKLRAARLEVARLDKKLLVLEATFERQLARLMTPAQVRFFLRLS